MTEQELNQRITDCEKASMIAIAKVSALNELIRKYADWKRNPISASLLLEVITNNLTDDRAEEVVSYSNSIKPDPRNNPLTDDDDWIHDVDMGAR